MEPGFEIGGCPKCVCKHAKVFFSATLTFKSTTRFGHLGIVTLSSQLLTATSKHEKKNCNFEALCGYEIRPSGTSASEGYGISSASEGYGINTKRDTG